VPRLWRRHGQSGFTLIEVLISVAMLGIVAVVIGQAIVVSTNNSRETPQRLNESHDAQLASAYLATDVQSAQQLTDSAHECGPSSPLTGQQNLVNFSYDGVDGGNSTASYYYGTTSGQAVVVRTFCASDGTLQTEATLVKFAGPTPAVTCPTSANPGANCDPLNTPKPNRVKISFTDHNNVLGTDDYSFDVTGARRGYAGPGSPGPIGAFPPLLALAGSGCGGTLNVSTSPGGSLTVNGGDAIVNSTCQPAVQFGGNGTLSITKPGSALQIASPGTCSGGSCSTNTVTPRPAPVPDPFAGLTIPDETGLPVFTDGNPAHGPGVYRGTPLTFPNGTTNLGPGLYIVEAGFSFSGQAVVVANGTQGVMLFNGCGLNAPVSCSNTGPFSVTGQVSLNLSPMTTGPYKDTNIVIWQPLANTSPLTIEGNGAASAITGVVYAPGASVITLGAGNGGLSIGNVVGPNIRVAGNGSVVVG
jgi:prepilin-type N-terminal cleavage/methylation domain-containing protein